MAFTVFVCSTFNDLSEERKGVLDAIQRLKLKHDSMEFFGARAEQPIETCLQEVRVSDILVVIVGHRYGSIVAFVTCGLRHRHRSNCVQRLRSFVFRPFGFEINLFELLDRFQRNTVVG
jgi:hypothetical protein